MDENIQTSNAAGTSWTRRFDWRRQKTWAIFVGSSSILGTMTVACIIIGNSIVYVTLGLDDIWRGFLGFIISGCLLVVSLHYLNRKFQLYKPGSNQAFQDKTFTEGRDWLICIPWIFLILLPVVTGSHLFHQITDLTIPLISRSILPLPIAITGFKACPQILERFVVSGLPRIKP